LVAKQLSSSQLAQANARLESMRNGAPGTAQSGPGPAQVAAGTGADEQLRKQLQAMKAENDRLLALQQKVDEERANLSSQLQSALAENSQLAAKVDTISRSIAATQKDPKSDPKITYLMEENTRLNNEVTRSTKELSSILRQLRVANSKSNSAPQPSGSSADSDQSEALSSLRQEVASLRDDNQRLTTESRKQVAGNISPIEIHNLRDQVASGSQALAQLTEAKQQITTLSQELENTKEAHKTALAAKTELEGKLTAAGQAQNGDNAKVQRLKGLVTEAQSNLVSSQREMEGLKVQLNSTQAEFRDGSAAARAKISEIETVARQLEVNNKNFTGQVASLQIALSAADIRPVYIGDSSRIQALESELNSSRQIARELSQRLSNLENEQARLSLEKDNALNQVTELQRNLAAKGSDAVRSVDLESKLNASKSAERRLAQQLAGAQSERNRLALENEEVIRQIAQLRQSLAANGGDTARAADLGSKLNASKSAESRLAQQLADTELDRQRFIREQQDTKNQRAILQRQLQDSQENQSAAEATLQPKLDEANTQLSSLFAKLQNLDSANRDLEQANSDLKNQITKLTAENQQLATTSRSNASQSSQATDQTARLNAEIDEAARVIAEREATIKELTVQMSSLHSDLDNSRKSAAAALAAQAQAAQALPDARATLMEIQSLQAQVSVLENHLGQERSQSAEAMAKLSDQLNRANETSKSLSDANRSLILGKNSNTETLESDLQDAQTRADELAAINASLVQERVEQRAQFEAMAFKLSSTEKQLSDMQSNEAASKAAANKAQDELQKLQAKFATSDTALNRQGGTVAELTGINENLTKGKLFLETQLAGSRNQALQVQNELDQIKTQRDGQIRLAATETNAAKIQAEKLQTKLDEATNQIEELKSENTHLSAADSVAADLRTQLTTVQGQLAEVEQTAQSQAVSESQLLNEKSALSQRLELATNQLDSLRSENSRLVETSKALVEANSRIDGLTAALAQFNIIQKDLVGSKAENTRLNQVLQALDRDRASRITSLEQENSALSARLRQAQGTLDQIASAARYVNSNGVTSNPAPTSTPTRTTIPQVETPRFHIVVEGDSLSRISTRYFGTANRWQEIYEANREVFSAENVLRPGQRLNIP
jgi:chromosome segregation ATPase